MRRLRFALVSLALLTAPVVSGQTSFPYVINTFAGSYPLGDGGPATSALLMSPSAVAVDGNGNIYIADNGNSLIRKVTAGSGAITTVPGGTNIACSGLKVDDSGNLYIAEATRVRKLTPSGALSVIADQLRNPAGIALGSAGDVFISDTGNHRVRKVTREGTILTVAGTGTAGYNGDNIPAASANLNNPRGLAVDGSGNLYIADSSNRRIRKVTPDGMITTWAGTGASGFSGNAGPATAALLQAPGALLLDPAGNLYLADSGRVRKISPAGIIQLIAGTGDTSGLSGDNGHAYAARIDPSGLAMDSAGNLYIADSWNCRIRMVAGDQTITTVAGASHFAGDGGPATSAVLRNPYYVVLDAAGNLYISDTDNHRVRKVDPAGTISTYAGTGERDANGDSGTATEVNIGHPRGLALDPAGNLYIADWWNKRIRRVAPDGTIDTVKGTANCCGNLDGLAMDPAGNLYASDYNGNHVYQVTWYGYILDFAGAGDPMPGWDGISANRSTVYHPRGLAVDPAGDVFIADSGNAKVRMVEPSVLHIISTLEASVTGVAGLAEDSSGNLYSSSDSANTISRMDPSGAMRAIAGNGRAGFSGDGGPATSATFNGSTGIAVDGNGDVYVADRANHRVRKLWLNSPVRLEIAGGNGQTGTIGKALPAALAVKLVGRVSGVAGVPVTFAVTSGAASPSAATVITDASGLASAPRVTLGYTAGPVTVTATAAAVPAVTFDLTAATGSGAPAISPGGIEAAVSPNALVSIYGSNFASQGTAGNPVNGRVPVKVAGICVQVGNELAPILAVYPAQINIQIPNPPVGADVPVQVIKNCGAGEVKSNIQTVSVRAATPEFFPFTLTAAPGDLVTIYGTGFGATTPSYAPGELPSQLARTLATPQVTLGALDLAATDILYAGVTTGSAGLYQLNIRIPADTPVGNQPVTLWLGDASTPIGAFITVRR